MRIGHDVRRGLAVILMLAVLSAMFAAAFDYTAHDWFVAWRHEAIGAMVMAIVVWVTSQEAPQQSLGALGVPEAGDTAHYLNDIRHLIETEGGRSRF